jgi:pyruvate dehydrogenase (quinone)
MDVAPTVADYLLERLRAWDVRHVFAYAGDGINGILAAWGRAENKPQFIQARHEEMAAFEAVGYAKFTGRAGGLHGDLRPRRHPSSEWAVRREARSRPVVAIVGQTDRSAMGG